MTSSISDGFNSLRPNKHLIDFVLSCTCPTYVYDLQSLDQDLRSFWSTFDNLSSGWKQQAYYMIPSVFLPANRRESILRVFEQNNFSATIIRYSDLAYVKDLGFDDSRIIVSGFGHSFHDLDLLSKTNCQVNLSSEPEIRCWARSGKPVGLRLDCKKIGQRKDWPFDKLGIPASKIISLVSQYNLEIAGLHFYVGTDQKQIALHISALQTCLDMAKSLASRVNLNSFYCNAGGGFPLNQDVLMNFLSRTNQLMLDNKLCNEIQLNLELGRALLGKHCLFVAPINYVFEKEDIFFFALNACISQFPRPARYGFHRLFPPFSDEGKHEVVIITKEARIIAQNNGSQAEHNVVLAGNSHYSRDILGSLSIQNLPDARLCAGGFVVFLCAGAYCESMTDYWLCNEQVTVNYFAT